MVDERASLWFDISSNERFDLFRSRCPLLKDHTRKAKKWCEIELRRINFSGLAADGAAMNETVLRSLLPPLFR
jgi:hypothetical protein